jgi:hypothetical protein
MSAPAEPTAVVQVTLTEAEARFVACATAFCHVMIFNKDTDLQNVAGEEVRRSALSVGSHGCVDLMIRVIRLAVAAFPGAARAFDTTDAEHVLRGPLWSEMARERDQRRQNPK